MSRTFSFRDLLRIPDLSGFNEIELLHPNQDEVMTEYLGQLGFDLDYAIQYIPSNHRDLSGRVGVGFRAVGEVTVNRNYINSPLCSLTERMVAAYHLDPSLAKELAQLQGRGLSFTTSERATEEDTNYPDEDVESSYREVSDEILTLEKIRDTLRGSPYNEYGSLKLMREYQF